MQPASSAKPPPGPERFPPEEGRLPPPGLSSGRHHVHPEEGRPPRASGNPQQEPGEPATVEEPSGMLGITRVQSASSAIPPPGPGLTLPEGRRLPPPDLSTGRQHMPPGKGQPSRKRTADAVELPSRSGTFVAGKEDTVAAESAFEGRAVVAANGTGRRFAEKYGASGCWIGGRKTGQYRAKLDADSWTSEQEQGRQRWSRR